MDDLAFALQAQRSLEQQQQSQFSQHLSPTSQQFSSQGSQPSQGGSPRPSGEALCKCGVRAACFQVKKETANKGRWFYRCNTDRCNFFQWADNRPNFNSPQRSSGQGRATGTSSQFSFDHQPSPQLSPPWPAQLSPGQPQLSPHHLQQASSSSLPVARQLPFSNQGGGPGSSQMPLQYHQAMSPLAQQPAAPSSPGYGGGSLQNTPLEFQRRMAQKASQQQQQPQHTQAQMFQAQQQAMAQEAALQQEQQQQLYRMEEQQRYQAALAQQEELFRQQEQEHLLLPPVSATSPPPSACKPPKGITVVLEMEGSDRFMARSKYHEDMPAAIKSTNRRVTDYKWDRDRKAWSFAVAGYPEMVCALKMAGFTVDELPSELLGGGPSAPKLPGYRLSLDQIPQRVPESLWNRLLPFQKEGVQFILSTQGRALLADEMGLGKSVQALAAAAAYFPQSWPLLIICPSSLRFMWADAVRNWLPAEMQPAPSDLWVISSIQEFNKVSKRGIPTSRPHVCVTSYDLVQKMDGLERQYRFIIADESHALKSPQAKRTSFVSRLLESQANQPDRRALLITGTPVLSRPIEIWSQVNMLRPKLLGSYHEFGQRYCISPGTQTSYSSPYAAPEYRGACRLTELNQRLTAAVMIRRQKDDVASQLPDKIRQKVPIEAEGNAAELRNINSQLQQNPVKEASNTQEEQGLDAIARTMGLQSERERSKQEKDALLTAYWRATGPAKTKGGVAFLNDLLDRGDVKVLVFAHHQAVLDAYENAMRKGKVGFVRIDGSSNDAHRKSAVDSFQMQKGTRVALLSITAAAVGLTLNAAQACLFAELHWTPSLLMQAEDRAHRIGVKSSVTCYYLIAKNTADDIMWPMINSKLSVIGTLIDGRSGQGSGGMESGAGGALPSPQAAKRQRTGLDERAATPKRHHSEQVIVISDDD